MSKLVGYFKNQFTDKNDGRVIDYAKIFISEDIKKNGAGINVVNYKAAVQVIDMLKPDCLGRECSVYFDKYNRVQLIQFEK